MFSTTRDNPRWNSQIVWVDLAKPITSLNDIPHYIFDVSTTGGKKGQIYPVPIGVDPPYVVSPIPFKSRFVKYNVQSKMALLQVERWGNGYLL